MVMDARVKGWDKMNQQTLDRRQLGKAMVALAVGAIFSLSKRTAAEPMESPASKGEPVRRMQKDEKKFFTCILRRQPKDECVAVFRQIGSRNVEEMS